MVRACNGKDAWEWRSSGETSLLEGPEKSQAIEQSQYHDDVNWRNNFKDVKGTWKLAGKTDSGESFKLLLDGEAVTLEIGEALFAQDLRKDPVDEPPGSGGLLVAMSHLRMLLTERGVRFSEYYYLGKSKALAFLLACVAWNSNGRAPDHYSTPEGKTKNEFIPGV